MCFSRSRTPLPAVYTLNGDKIREVDDIKDLGVTIDTKLTFHKHIDGITQRAFKILGFITRNSKDFKNPYSLICLFKTQVLPILEYGSIIWSPYTEAGITRLERVQRKLCKTLAFRHSSSTASTTEDIYIRYNINSLRARRRITDLAFFYKVVNGIIDAPEVRSSFELAPAGLTLRNSRLLKTVATYKSYVYHGPCNRIPISVNSLHGVLDFYGGTYDTFLRNAKNIIL
ncbi:uncharacterized protein LOC128870442 [Anastrepha ludens]|uniref:uncharacterized protein LOC128870442 n=1 Tax=Anastrepha ludens TaxID=28586 RepID=UPI0023B181BC|nr:uncharacterized protein LOC128870442 [Anastrepha ludens]